MSNRKGAALARDPLGQSVSLAYAGVQISDHFVADRLP